MTNTRLAAIALVIVAGGLGVWWLNSPEPVAPPPPPPVEDVPVVPLPEAMTEEEPETAQPEDSAPDGSENGEAAAPANEADARLERIISETERSVEDSVERIEAAIEAASDVAREGAEATRENVERALERAAEAVAETETAAPEADDLLRRIEEAEGLDAATRDELRAVVEAARGSPDALEAAREQIVEVLGD